MTAIPALLTLTQANLVLRRRECCPREHWVSQPVQPTSFPILLIHPHMILTTGSLLCHNRPLRRWAGLDHLAERKRDVNTRFQHAWCKTTCQDQGRDESLVGGPLLTGQGVSQLQEVTWHIAVKLTSVLGLTRFEILLLLHSKSLPGQLEVLLLMILCFSHQ